MSGVSAGRPPQSARGAAIACLLVVCAMWVSCHSVAPGSQAKAPSAPSGATGASANEPSSQPFSEPDTAPAKEGELVQLELDGSTAFPLLVWAPSGNERRPVIISAHGAGCLAEQHCAYLWRLSAGRAIVACLRGEPLFRARPEQGFYFRDHLALGRELEDAAGVLRAHFGERLGPRWTFVGYSQGATMGALALPESTLRFEQLVFIEGGGEGMTRRSMERLRESGTRRVLFACGTPGCERRARDTAAALISTGMDARASYAEGAGHTYLGSVEQIIAEQLPWLWP